MVFSMMSSTERNAEVVRRLLRLPTFPPRREMGGLDRTRAGSRVLSGQTADLFFNVLPELRIPGRDPLSDMTHLQTRRVSWISAVVMNGKENRNVVRRAFLHMDQASRLFLFWFFVRPSRSSFVGNGTM